MRQAGTGSVPFARLALWAALLAAGQMADMLTTGADMSYGAIEANRMAAGVISTGGMVLLGALKLALVLVMIAAVALAESYSRQFPGRRAALARILVWRAMQICAVMLVATALHNVLVLAQIQGWLPAVAITAWRPTS